MDFCWKKGVEVGGCTNDAKALVVVAQLKAQRVSSVDVVCEGTADVEVELAVSRWRHWVDERVRRHEAFSGRHVERTPKEQRKDPSS